MRNPPTQSLSFMLAAFVLASSALCGAASAEDYPDRAVKIIVPFPAGGTADAVPRIVGDWLSRKWGQPVVVENCAHFVPEEQPAKTAELILQFFAESP